MPKSDYTKTIMYVIKCKDINIIKKYYGHTTNFKVRKSSHKNACNNESSSDYNDNKYKFIRENGGWSNWEMNEIELYTCNNVIEARIREQFHIDNDTNSLNMDKAYRTKEQHLKYMRDWHETNKNKINEALKDKYINDDEFKTKRLEQSKIYRLNNVDKISEWKKDYYKKNIEKYKIRMTLNHTCDCGAIVRKCHLLQHCQSLKHTTFINNKI